MYSYRYVSTFRKSKLNFRITVTVDMHSTPSHGDPPKTGPK